MVRRGPIWKREASGMRRSAIVLLVLYAILGVIAAVLILNPVIETLLVFLTLDLVFFFGVGLLLLPIAFAPAAFLYATALLPALIAYGYRRSARLVLVIAVVPVVLVAFGPPAFERLSAAIAFRSLHAADFEKPASAAPRSIEIVRRVSPLARPDVELLYAPCLATCQKLLLNGEAERVVETAVDPSGSVLHHIGYTMAQRPACPPAFANAADALPETVSAAAQGTCIVPAIGDVAPVAVTVSDIARTPREPGFDGPTGAFGVTVRGVRRLEIVERTEAAPVTLVHDTEVTVSVLAMPLLLLPKGGGTTFPRASRWWQVPLVDHPIDLDETLRRVLGYKIAPITAFKPEDSRTLLRLLLDRPGDQPVDDTGQRALRDVMESLYRAKGLSDADVKLIGAVIGDRRFSDVAMVTPTLAKFPELTRRFLPQLVARLETPQAPRSDDHRMLAGAVMRLPPADLKPYVARLLALADGGAWWASPIVTRAGELAADPVPLLARSLAAKDFSFRDAAVTGICRLDPAIAAPLVEPLAQYLAARQFKDAAPHDVVAGIVALRRFGRDADANRLIAGLTEKQAQSLDRSLKALRPAYPGDPCGI